MKTLRVGIRDKHSFKDYDVLLDAQVGCNTPVERESPVRGNHLDNKNKLIAGFIYFRLEQDESIGGEFMVCNSQGKVLHPIKYGANNFLFFVNTKRSYHLVSSRSQTEYPRIFINFVATVSKDLF